MPLTIIHATCAICRQMLPADDVLPCQEGEAYAHAACLLRSGLIDPLPCLALAVIPRLLPLDELRAMKPPPKEHALSPSTGHLILKSPKQAWWKKFGGGPREYTDATEFGTLCHALLLGGQDIVCVDADDWRTKKAQADRAEARAAGKIPVLKAKLQAAEDTANDVRRRLLERGYDLTKGERELDVTWREGNVLCRGRIDWWEYETARWLDLKFVADASMRKCVLHMIEYGAAIQWAAYTSALEKRHPELAGRIQGRFGFFEPDPPSEFCIRPLAGTMRTVGRSRWRRAVATWQSCLERYGADPDVPWPGYEDDESEMEAPTWVLEIEEQKMTMEVSSVPF